MRRLWPERALRFEHHGRELRDGDKHKMVRRWRSGRSCPGLVVTAEAPAARVTVTDPRQVVWRDGYPSNCTRLPSQVPPGRELLQVEVDEDVAEQLRREAAERGMPVADLLARLVGMLNVGALVTKRASMGA